MKAAILVDKNKVEVKEIELPELRKGDVLVKIRYAGLCGTQIGEIKGLRGEDKFIPHLLGHEASGEVVDIGEGVTKVGINDKVICSWMKGPGLEGGPKKYENKYNAGSISTFQEYSVISENRLIKVKSDTNMMIASLFGCMIPTGVRSVINILSPDMNKTIAIVGCGNIGSASIIGAKYCGCKSITAIDIDNKKKEYCYQLGATEFKNVVDKKYDYIVETTGNASVIHKCIDMLDDSGKLVIASNPSKKIEINPVDLNKGKIYGSWGGFKDRQNCNIEGFVDCYINCLNLDDLRFSIYSLDEINEAVADFEHVVGKILIEVS